jgi:hypothetical protein
MITFHTHEWQTCFIPYCFGNLVFMLVLGWAFFAFEGKDDDVAADPAVLAAAKDIKVQKVIEILAACLKLESLLRIWFSDATSSFVLLVGMNTLIGVITLTPLYISPDSLTYAHVSCILEAATSESPKRINKCTPLENNLTSSFTPHLDDNRHIADVLVSVQTIGFRIGLRISIRS